MVNTIYTEKVNTNYLKYKAKQDKDNSYYFDKDTISFFNSKIESAKSNSDRDKIIFKEKIKNPCNKEERYKFGIYDDKTKKLKVSDLYEDKKKRDEDYNKVYYYGYTANPLDKIVEEQKINTRYTKGIADIEEKYGVDKLEKFKK